MATKKVTTKKTTKKKKEEEEVDLTGKKQLCICCGKNQAYSNFYKSRAKIYSGNNGMMCFCKSCLNDEYYGFLQATSMNPYLAIKMTCAKFSIPFDESFAKGALKQKDVCNTKDVDTEEYAFSLYMKNLNSLGKRNGAQTEFDYVSALAVTDEENVCVDIFNDKARSLKITNEMVEFWDGVKDRKKLYILEKIWNEYSDAYKMSNPVHIKLFKECAFLELQGIEKRNANINADISDITKKITELLGSLNLLPKNNKGDSGGEVASCDGILVKAIEDKHPIDDTQWKDKQNFMECIGYMWRGHTMKNLGEPDVNPQYDKIMKDLAIESVPLDNDDVSVEDAIEEGEDNG